MTACSAGFIASDGTDVTLRRGGDGGVLVEYGPMVLDLAMRARVHVLYEHLRAKAIPGITELTPECVLCRCNSILRCSRWPEATRPAGRHGQATCPRRISSSCRVAPSGSRCRGMTRRTHEAIQRYMHGRPRGCPVVPMEHGVHPAHQRSRRCGTGARTVVFARTGIGARLSVTSTWVHRFATPLDPRHRPGDHESTTRRGHGHRRTLSASVVRTCASTAWRGRADPNSSVRTTPGVGTTATPTVQVRSNLEHRGCCVISIGSASTRSARTS